MNKLNELSYALSGCKRMMIFTHDYPDPDSIASALALSYLLKHKFNIKSKIIYGGLILRAENTTMVQQLNIKMDHINSIRWGKKNNVALVDTQKKFSNHSLPKFIKPMIVFDHHHRQALSIFPFSDIREKYGATATILYEYLEEANVEIAPKLATAISYAISSETQDLGRDASAEDIEVYTKVFPIANKKVLSKIKNPKLSQDFYLILNTALEKAKQYRNTIHVHLGEIPSPEFISQIADLLLRHERVTWSLVTGRFEKHLYVSLRTSNDKTNVGRLLQRVIGRRGFAGGHRMIAGGRINMDNPNEQKWIESEELVIQKFLKKINYNVEISWKPMIGN